MPFKCLTLAAFSGKTPDSFSQLLGLAKLFRISIMTASTRALPDFSLRPIASTDVMVVEER